MSIEDLIAAAEVEGKLHRFVPSRSRHPCRRRAYLSKAAVDQIANKQSAMNMFRGAGYVEAALTRWVLGERIYKGFLKRLKPPPVEEIWEIRVVEPNPKWRVFFSFAAADTIIISRSHTRGYLGDKGSKAWKDAMTSSAQFWKDIFGDSRPFIRGERSVEYVTENCDDFKV